MEFYKFLKKCRERRHVTQEELVTELYEHDNEIFKNLDSVTLSRWERDTTKPNILKKLSILKYFQKYNTDALPCWDNYSMEEVESLICTLGIQNIFGKNKQLVLNFPSEMMSVDELKIYTLDDVEKYQVIFELNMDLHQATSHPYTQVSMEQFITWAQHPSTLFLACDYKGGFVGLFFSLRLKEDVFDKIMNFEMRNSEIEVHDLAEEGEVGADLLISFYAINSKVASALFVRHYAYLIANQRVISEIGVGTTLNEVMKMLESMQLKQYKEKLFNDGKHLITYRESLNNILASEYVIKMIFSEQA